MVELFINGTASAVGQLTLYGDEPLSLNISVADIKDISKRNSTFSQTFTLPADKNNNILLNHIFNIGADSSFDPSKKTQCFILNDGMPVFNGQFQLTKINVKNRNVISYESVVYGEMIDLVKALGDRLLTGNKNIEDDLDFSELNHIFSIDNIEASWSADTKTLGYYYPLIDYGYDLSLKELNSGVLSIVIDSGIPSSSTPTTLTDSTKLWATNAFVGMSVYIVSGSGINQSGTITSNTLTTLTITPAWITTPDNTSIYNITKLDTSNPYGSTGSGLSPMIFKPALSNTFLFKKILDKVGFSIDSNFIDSDILAETIMPFNGDVKDVLTTDYMDQYAFRVTMPDANSSGTTWLNIFTFNDTTTSPNFDNGNLFDYETYPGQPVAEWKYRYVADRHSSQSFVINLRYYFFGYNIVANKYLDVNFYRQKGPLATPVLFSSHSYDLGVPSLYVDYNLTIESKLMNNPTSTANLEPLEPGEIVYATYLWQFGGGNHLIAIRGGSTYMYNKISPELIPNGMLFYNKVIPKNIKQIDYVKSIITMFNLMVIPNKNNPKRLTFTPRNEYYAIGEVKDWSNKIDHTEKIEETLISEQQSKSIRLTYKEDRDYYNANYREKTNTIYGEYIEVIDNEWITGEKKIEVIFSPTPVDKVLGSTDVYIPKIAKRDEKSGIYGRTDFNIRFLRKNKTLMLTQDTIQLQGRPPQNTYPYCGHLDHPINPLVDYNFGAVSFVYYEGLSTMTPHNLVYDYWKEYLDDINDKNSKLIKCKIYLTPDDIAQFNYNDSIYIEGLTDDGGHYFNVNKINYIPTSNLPSTIELIKVNRRPVEVEPIGKELTNPVKLDPIKVLELGKNNIIESGSAIIIGDNNTVGYGNENSFILGSGNTIQNNRNSVVLINSTNQTITDSFTTIVGNTYFPQEGQAYTLFNDIDSGLDEVIYPFSKTILNDIDSGLDAVRNIGGQSVISDIDSGLS